MIRLNDELSRLAKSGIKSGRPGEGPSGGIGIKGVIGIGAGTVPNPFERLVQIWRGNERLLGELRKLQPQVGRTMVYLSDPGCRNRTLGLAQLERLRARQAAALTQLRSNRAEARLLLGPVDTAPAPCVGIARG